jgi:hypothetical protein
MNEADSISKTAPRWMLWATISSLGLSLATVLLMDMNGNIVFSQRASVPDVLSPGPKILVFLGLVASVVITGIHFIRYSDRRRIWALLFLLSLVFAVAIIAPTL